MTVNVHYTRKGEERVESFESEQVAGIFMDGLKMRDDHSFECVRYPQDACPKCGTA